MPVVVCDGSGRASDLLAFAHQYADDEGNMPEGIKSQLLRLIEDVFYYNKQNAKMLLVNSSIKYYEKNLFTNI